MTPGIVAQTLEELYYAGRPKEDELKLQYEDFLQMVYMANASVLRDRFQQDQLLSAEIGLGDLISSYELAITEDKYKRKVADLPVEVITLPNDAGVFSVTPLAADGTLVQCRPIIRMPAGSEWLYCNDTGSPFSYFTRYRNQLVFYLLDECVKRVLANTVSNDEDANMPDEIAWTVFKQVYAQVVRTYAIPVDKRADGNPNAEEIFQAKLTSPQTNR